MRDARLLGVVGEVETLLAQQAMSPVLRRRHDNNNAVGNANNAASSAYVSTSSLVT